MATDLDVLVVGAGPTGLLLAAELRRRGVEALLIDAHGSPMAWDRATVVHPRTIELFDSLGLAEPLLKAGVRQRLARVHSGGRALGDIDLSLCGSRYPFNLGVSEEVTEAILTDYLTRLGGAVTRSTRLVGLDQREGSVLATLEGGGSERQISAAWVVGCDGHRSTVRAIAGIEQDGHDIAEPWAVFDAAIRGWPYSHEANYAYLDETPIILTALPDDRWRVYLRPSASDSDLVADATETLARYLPGAEFAAVANATRFDCHTRVARHYRAGRLLLAGDAAHSCSPVQGHGMNSGLQDAFNLAWKLALVAKGEAAGTLLDSYEAERRPVAQKITASGDEADGAQMLRDPAERLARDAAIRRVLGSPEARHQEAVAEAELDVDYGASPIVMGEANNALAPGQRWPDQIELHRPDRAMPNLDSLVHRPGHTAILVAGASTKPDELASAERALDGFAMPWLEARFTLAIDGSGGAGYAGIDAAAGERLGADKLTLFVVRPDGYLGLRADADHEDALAAYAAAIFA